jgi:hypothetical protein
MWILVLTSVVCVACGIDETNTENSEGFVIAELPGTGTTGGNPTASVIVTIDEPPTDGILVDWQPPRLVFDRMQIWRLDATDTCVLDTVFDDRRVDVRLTRAQQLTFLGDRPCRVSLERDDGPVLLFDGVTATERTVQLAFAEDAALTLSLTQISTSGPVRGVMALQLRALLSGLEDAIVLPGESGVVISDQDAERGTTLQQNLSMAMRGYLDLDADGALSVDERVEGNVFLRLSVER